MKKIDLASLVDPSWYLEEYPDVLDAGVDPIQHYVNHGHHEGRYPYLLRARAIEEKLWLGFSRLALQDLENIVYANVDLCIEKSYAAWAAFRWYVSHFEWQKANAFIAILDKRNKIVPQLSFDILKSRVLWELGEAEQLARLNLYFQETYKACNHIDLVISNITDCPHCLSKASEPCARLNKINSIYARSRLLSIALINPKEPISLDNICASSTGTAIESKRKVSIIMPAFNAAKYIHTAIRSILSQTFKNLELLIVDDGSTDETFQILERFRLSDERIKLFRHTQTLGAYAARNTALLNSTGFYVTNHDSDDWSHPQRLELMVDSLQKNPGSVVALADWVRATPSLVFGVSKIQHGLIEPSVSTFIANRNLLLELGGWDEVRVAADSELLDRIRVVYGSDKVINVHSNTPLVLARSLETSLTNSVASHWKSDFYGMRKHYRILYSAFHKRLINSQEPFKSRGKQRMFPAPTTNLMNANDFIFDFVLIADFSASSNFQQKTELVHQIISQGHFVGLCHWPDYNNHGKADVADYFVDLELDYLIKNLTCDIHCAARYLVVLEPSLLAKPTSYIPKINFQHCLIKSSNELINFLNEPFAQDDFDLVLTSGEFWPDWYLSNNEDVRAQGVDPLHHFLTHGLKEHRLPNPEFNIHEYFKKVPRLLDFDWPPFMHYLKVGKNHELLHNINEFQGKLEYSTNRPTILVTAHAAGKLLFGAERCLLDVVASLSHLALNTIITVPQSSNHLYLETLKSFSVKIYVVPCAVWKGDSAPDEWALNKFCQIIEDNNVDVVLANTLTQREPLLAAKRKAKKSIAYVHESPQHDSELCSQMGLSADSITASIEKLADTIWVTSKYSSSSFESHRDIHIVGNTVDLEEFDIPNNVNQEKLKFAVISSNTPKKGVLDLIEIANLLSITAPNAEFLIIGPDNEFIREQKELQHLGRIGSNVSFIDYLENSVDAVKLTNVILSLSHCQETFARTVLEGMAARRPVLAYSWGALPELIDHEANGYLVPPLDVKAAAKLIEELAYNPNKIRSMGECGRAYIAVHHSPKSMQLQITESLKIFVDLPENAPLKKAKTTHAGRKKSSSIAKGQRKSR